MFSKKISFFVLGVILPLLGFASGFQLFEESGASMGNFGAGGSAIAEDASTNYNNPAGLVRIDQQQFVFSFVGVGVSGDFEGKVVNNSDANLPFLGEMVFPVSEEYGTADSHVFTPVPAFHYALPLNDRVVFGFSFAVPFGLSMDYSDHSFVRYASTDSYIDDLDFTPALGIKINDKWSVGAGLDVQRVSAEFDQVVGLGSLSSLVGVDDSDTKSHNEGSDWTLGWHAGVLYQYSPMTRVGLNYRSKVDVHIDGNSELSGPIADFANGGPLKTSNLEGDLTLPATTTLSLYHAFNETWAMMGTVIYTQWSQFDNVPLKNVAAVEQTLEGFTPVFTPTTLDVNVPQHFRDTWRFILGVDYRINDRWLLRVGAGYDQQPTNSTDRNTRLPDGDRIATAIGFHYEPNKIVSFDAGWTHLFIEDSDVHNTAVSGQQITRVDGEEEAMANLYGLQMTLNVA